MGALRRASSAAAFLRLAAASAAAVWMLALPAPAAAQCPSSSSGYKTAVTGTTGLSGYWRLDETSGTQACDSAGTNHGTYSGGYLLGQPGGISDGNPGITLENDDSQVKTQVLDKVDGDTNKPGRTSEYDYYDNGRLKTFIDRAAAGPGDDRTTTYEYEPVGWLNKRETAKTSTPTDKVQTQNWGFTKNGLVTSATTSNGAGTVVESHMTDYLRGGKYSNGHRVKDTFWMKNGNTAASCQTSATTCTTEWTYDARDRLTQELRKRGSSPRASVYELYPHDGIKSSRMVNPGPNGVIEPEGATGSDDTDTRARYFYDTAGNLSCVTTKDGNADLCATYRDKRGTGPWFNGLLSYDDYDPQDRLQAHKEFDSAGTVTLNSSTAYDALDRPIQVKEKHFSGGSQAVQSRCSVLSYFGLGTKVSQEERRPPPAGEDACSTNAADTTKTKSYGYDAMGLRVTMSEKVGTANPTEHTYAYDPRGSVSMLLDGNGSVKASYGYLPYGESDKGEPNSLTHEPPVDASGTAADPREPFNPYQYTGKRMDNSTGTLDMGARRFSPSIGGFLQEDAYDDALGAMS